MSEQQTATPSKHNYYLFIGTSGILIASFLFRTLTVAHEYPMRTEQVMTMLIDAGLMAGLFGVRKSGPAWLFWIGMIAGVGLFAIRLHGDASWWTGHLMYSLSRR
jgi:hypothetical protein